MILIGFILYSIVIFAPVIFSHGMAIDWDWSYFNALTTVIRSSVLFDHVLPIHNPWVCGGVDLLANPQSRLLSPWVATDILLPLHWPSVISMVVEAVFGMIGARRLALKLNVSSAMSTLFALLFVSSSWFGAHLAEGHIVFGAFQLMAWVPLFLLEIEKPANLFKLALLFAYFVLAGGIYAFVLCGLFGVFFMVLVRRDLLPALITRIARDPLLSTLSIAGPALLVLARLYPVLSTHSGMHANLMTYDLPLRGILTVFFSPRQSPNFWLFPGDANSQPVPFNTLRRHEFVGYIGVLSVLILIATLVKSREFRRTTLRWLPLLILYFWAGTGLFSPYNPWTIFQKIPILNLVHVNPRLLLFFQVPVFLLLVMALDSPIWSKFRQPIAALLIYEAIFVHAYPLWHSVEKTGIESAKYWSIIRHQRLESTVMMSHYPDHFLVPQGSSGCYDTAETQDIAAYNGAANYKGEAFIETGAGQANVERYVPGLIKLKVDAPAGSIVEINTRNLSGWKVSRGSASVLSSKYNDLLQIRSDAPKQEIELRYSPSYLSLMLALYLCGAMLVVFTFLILRGKKN